MAEQLRQSPPRQMMVKLAPWLQDDVCTHDAGVPRWQL